MSDCGGNKTSSSQGGESHSVNLYIYDLSGGIARSLAAHLIGQHIEGIWHTSIVVFGKEYFFGGAEGIVHCSPGGTVLGKPTKIELLGQTEVTKDVFLMYIDSLSSTNYRAQDYDLFHHNCNTFSHEVAQFLVGRGIPRYIIELPETILNTPLGPVIRQLYDQINVRQRGGRDINPAEIIIRERVLGLCELNDTMSQSNSSNTAKRRSISMRGDVPGLQEDPNSNREPPIVFRNFCSSIEQLIEDLEKSLAQIELNEDEKTSLRELRQYALGGEGSWVLSDEFLSLIERILTSGDEQIHEDRKVLSLKILACLAVTKDDLMSLLQQDRNRHILMKYAGDIDKLSPRCQEGVALFICNLFENFSTSEWLLYISDWKNGDCGQTSNIRVTTKVGVHALNSEELKDVGSAILYNVVAKERLGQTFVVRSILPARSKSKVFDDVAVEIALAILNFLPENSQEGLAWRALKSLLRCCTLASSEVPAVVKMIGPSPTEFTGTSSRCDDIIKEIDQLLKAVA